ncbi:MAG TPA: DUF3048 domain-containing protein [Euzebya sp.]|nr:DUF3048 domain-containing protein [Euzebya sp.]
MRLRFLLPALIIALLAACGGDPEVEPTEKPTEVTQATEEATKEPTENAAEEPTEEPTQMPGPVNPLTGEALTDEALLDAPVVLVKVDNDERARPQVGLDQADIVVVEPVEGLTRLGALFHSADPGEVGPVRSGRLIDPQLFGAFGPIFAFSGAALPNYPAIDAGFPATVVHDRNQSGWRREGSRPAPHNLFVPLTHVRSAAPDVAGPGDQPVFAFDADLPDGGTPTAGFTIDYGPFRTQSGWTWQEGEGWVRSQDGTPHTAGTADRTPGQALVADNVVVMTVPATGSQVEPVTIIGEGPARIHRGAQVFEGTWSKASAEDQVIFTTTGGAVLPLAPGTTWIEVLPSSGRYLPGAPDVEALPTEG